MSWQNRAHFFGFAAQAMRQILVDYARIRRAEKRNDGQRPLSLDEVTEVAAPWNPDLLDLDDALRRLAEVDPRAARVAELRLLLRRVLG